MGFMHLGKMTFAGLFKKPETLLYPSETKQPPQGLKGSVAVEVEKCILCNICARNCPCEAIEMNKAERVWQINHFRCIQCSYCVRSCPKNALVMLPHYTAPASKIAPEVFIIPEVEKASSSAE